MKFKLDVTMTSFELTSILFRLLRGTDVHEVSPREGELLSVLWSEAKAHEDGPTDSEFGGTWLGIHSHEEDVTIGWRGQWTPGRWMTVRFESWARATYKVADCPKFEVSIECSLGEDDSRHPKYSKFFSTVLGEYAEQMEVEVDSIVAATVEIAKGLRNRPESHRLAAVEWLQENGHGHLL